MWKDEIIMNRTVTVPCKSKLLSVDAIGVKANTKTWMRDKTITEVVVLYPLDITGNKITIPHSSLTYIQVAICIGQTKLTIQARSFLSKLKPPTDFSAANQTGRSVSYVVWISPSTATNNIIMKLMTIEEHRENDHAVLKHWKVVILFHFKHYILFCCETVISISLAENAWHGSLTIKFGVYLYLHFFVHFLLLLTFFQRKGFIDK